MAERRKKELMQETATQDRQRAHEGRHHPVYPGAVSDRRGSQQKFSPRQRAHGYSPACWKTFNP